MTRDGWPVLLIVVRSGRMGGESRSSLAITNPCAVTKLPLRDIETGELFTVYVGCLDPVI